MGKTKLKDFQGGGIFKKYENKQEKFGFENRIADYYTVITENLIKSSIEL